MTRVSRTDVGASVTGTMTNIQRTDATLFRGVGELEGQDEYRAVDVVDGVGGPKFRKTDANADTSEQYREKMINDEMAERAKNPPRRVDANESALDKARREMTDRNLNAWKQKRPSGR